MRSARQKHSISKRRRRKSIARPRAFRPRCEPLEDRRLLAVDNLMPTDNWNPLVYAQELVVTVFEDENDGDYSAGDLSLREAIILANQSSYSTLITLPAGEFHLSIEGRNEDDGASGDLDIHSNVGIRGAGAGLTTINAGGIDRVFDVHDVQFAKFNSLTITGGDTDENGGGIRSLKNVEINNSTIAGNTAAVHGGGIYTHFGNLLIRKSVIEQNTALFGGGVYSGRLYVYSGTFRDNHATEAGGAIYGGDIPSQDSERVAVANSLFSGNSAGRSGGAIFVTHRFNMDGSEFRDNEAGLRGGAIAIEAGSTSVITNSVFTGNRLLGAADLDEFATGGAIYSAGNLAIGDSEIRNNSAVSNNTSWLGRGGGIYSSGVLHVCESVIANNTANVGGGIASVGGSATIELSVFHGNQAIVAPGEICLPAAGYECVQEGFGGGVANYSDGVMTITQTTIAGNEARQGGGVYNRGEMSIVDSTITGNNTTHADAFNSRSFGGGIYNAGDLTIAGSTITHNVSSQGGGIYNHDSAQMHVSRSNISHNLASSSPFRRFGGGGGIYNRGQMRLEESVLSFNESIGGDGGAVNNDEGEAEITDCTFSHNKASSGLTITFVAGAFESASINNPSQASAAIGGTANNSNSSDYAQQLLVTSPFVGSGGAISNSASMTVIDCTLAKNEAEHRGGAVSNKGNLTISHSDVLDNSAGGFGGGVFNGGEMNIVECIIQGNQAMRGGGISNRGQLSVVNSQVVSNRAAGPVDSELGQGGGIHSDHVDAELKILRSSISHNTAKDGGGIHNEAGTILIESSNVANNTAVKSGGGVYNAGEMTIVDSQIEGNRAGGETIDERGEGGGIFNQGALRISHSAITFNTAHTGGGLYAYSGEATIVASTISNNQALPLTVQQDCEPGPVSCQPMVVASLWEGAGGGVFVHDSAALTLEHSTVAENRAEAGGGVYNVTFRGHLAISPPIPFEMTGDVQLTGSIIAGNETPSENSNDFHGVATSLGQNLIGDASGAEIDFQQTDLVNIDPRLGPLQDNGGPTLTHALLPGSPAIDAGDPDFAPEDFDSPLTFDQRGLPRVVDGDGDGEAVIDIGAVEDQQSSQAIETISGSGLRHNAANPYDTNGDGIAAPNDILEVINELVRRHDPSSPQTQAEGERTVYLDVDNDGQLAPIDALWIFDHLVSAAANNHHAAGPDGELAEGESADPNPARPLATTPPAGFSAAIEASFAASEQALRNDSRAAGENAAADEQPLNSSATPPIQVWRSLATALPRDKDYFATLGHDPLSPIDALDSDLLEILANDAAPR